MKKKIIFTGGSGRFAKVFRKLNYKENIFFPTSKQLNIESLKSIKKYLNKINPTHLIHAAALSRPMKIHEKKIIKSINTNIIGTANIVKACYEKKIKLIYFSTNHVYPGIKGNYKETDPVLPINKYAISKFGGECCVQMYENSLILRICMTENPFIHEQAFNDVEANFMFHDEFAKNLLKLIDQKGIINVGGPTQSIFSFAKKNNKEIKNIAAKKIYGAKYPLKQSMNINLYKKSIR
jgi:dTDP-4-dehydrorhamnose reductase